MEIKKDYAMLIDVQYVRANKAKGEPDFLYIIWKDLRDNEKHLNIIPEPMMKIYFEKPEFRNHTYNKNYARLEELDEVTVKYKDIIYAIANDMGEPGRARLNECFTTRNYRALNEFYIYPYVYGADYDIRVWYRYQWAKEMSNDLNKPISKAFLDIEVDSLEATGFPKPEADPIDCVTLIDGDTKTSYTFILTGRECVERDLTNVDPLSKKFSAEMRRRDLYQHRKREEEYLMNNIDELEEEAHKMFDEGYPGMEYKFYFYDDERKLIVHLFQLINMLKKDFLLIWNIAFDIPYILDRCVALGLDPAQVICHPDFPVRECWFKKDKINFAVKNKADFFHCSSYTIYSDQMRNYAAIRKGGPELRSYRLNNVAKNEIGDEKLDYSEEGNIKTLAYRNLLLYILYNIKDVLLQDKTEDKTLDLETFYLTSYGNLTPYESEFKQTVKLRNVQYEAFFDQGLVPGENVNGFLYNNREEPEEDDDDEEGSKKKTSFEGALVADPTLNGFFGEELFGKKTNSIFRYSVDFDMSAFYPSTIRAMNIDPSTLIFKMSLDASQYDVRGGDIPFHGITDIQTNPNNDDSFHDDIAKEVMDNFQTKNYLSAGYKWLNLPSVNEMYEYLSKKWKEKG